MDSSPIQFILIKVPGMKLRHTWTPPQNFGVSQQQKHLKDSGDGPQNIISQTSGENAET
jgi:hypothetical protein